MPLGWWSYGTVRCTYCEKNSNSSLFLTELVQNNAWALRSCPDFALQSPRYLSKLISYIQQIWLFPGLLAGNPTWPLCSGTNFPLFTLPTDKLTWSYLLLEGSASSSMSLHFFIWLPKWKLGFALRQKHSHSSSTRTCTSTLWKIWLCWALIEKQADPVPAGSSARSSIFHRCPMSSSVCRSICAAEISPRYRQGVGEYIYK